MRKKILAFSILTVCVWNNLAHADTIGFGLGGGWGLNLMGFNGEYDGKKSKFGIGQLFSAKTFIDYSFGEEGKEGISIALDIGFMQRTIEADFVNNTNDKSKPYTLGETKTFTLDCIEAIFKIILNYFQFEYGIWGPYLGFGGYYMIRGSLADEDVEATKSQYEIVEASLDKLNILMTAGLQAKFLDRILAITIGGTYSFLNQVKPDYADTDIKYTYRNKVSVGNGQIGVLAELKIDLWQIIIG
jgi:hypothetical protein